MGHCNLTLARHLEQVQLRDEYLLQERRRRERWSRPAVLVAATGQWRELPATVRIAARPRR